MDWDALQTLLAVSRAPTLAKAAASLGVNATTVSRRLDALEESLGTRMVDRGRDGVRLTEQAEGVIALIEQMETLALALSRAIVGGDARLTGPLRVGTTDTVAAYHPEVFSSFAERHPQIELTVASSYGVHSLVRREADVVIRWTNHPDEQLFGRKLARAKYAVYASKSLVASLGAQASAQSLPWINWDTSTNAQRRERWIRAHYPEVRIVCRYDSALALAAALEAGVGAALMPCAYCDGNEVLQRLTPPVADFGYELWALAHPSLAGTARVGAFLQHAGEYFGKLRQRFEGATAPPDPEGC